MRMSVVLACGLVLAACSKDPAPAADVQDVPSDVVPDAVIDAAPDVVPDVAPDAPPDAPPDAAPDAPPDPGVDVPAATPLPDDWMGMCPIDSDPNIPEWDRVQAWGVKLVREGFFWEWITNADGTLDYSWPDRYFAEAEKRGIGVLVDLCYDNKTFHQPGDPRPSIPASQLQAWRAYVVAIASRYKDRAWGFEVWNEPNLDIFWKGSMEDFIALAKVTVEAVHEAAPGVPVSVAGLASAGVDWLDALHAAGVVAAADAVSFHPYWLDAEGSLDTIGVVQDWLYQNRLDKPLWLTEYGWPTGGTYPTATTLDGQAERLIRFQAGAALTGVRATWMFASYDWEDPEDVKDPSNSEGFFGVAYRTAGDKPAARAYQVLAGILPGSVPDAAAGRAFAAGTALDATGFRRADGTMAVIATNRTAAPVVLSLPEGAVVAWPEPAARTVGAVTVPADRSVVVTGLPSRVASAR